MAPLAIAQAVLTYGPDIIPLIHQLQVWITEKKVEVTSDDTALLNSYRSKKGADYFTNPPA